MCKISKNLDIYSKSFDVSEPKSMFHNVSTKIVLWHDLFDLFQSFFTLLYLGFSFWLKENDVDDANRVCTQLSANNCQESLFSGFTNPNKLSFCTLPPTIWGFHLFTSSPSSSFSRPSLLYQFHNENKHIYICCSPKFEIFRKSLNHQKSSSHSHHLPHYHHNENMHTCCAVPQKWDFQHFIATPPSYSLLTSQWRHTCAKFVFCPHCNCVGWSG